MTNEIWRDIPSYEGLYQASNYGRIKSLHHNKERIMRTPLNSKGRPFLGLTIGRWKQVVEVHVLVALAFLGERPEGMVVNHISGDRTDNRVENLEYVTQYENMHHAIEIDRLRGMRREDVLSIINLINTTDLSLNKISALFNVHMRTVSRIMHGERWREYAHLVDPEAKAKRTASSWINASRNRKEQAS